VAREQVRPTVVEQAVDVLVDVHAV